jgi:predicted lipoprotein
MRVRNALVWFGLSGAWILLGACKRGGTSDPSAAAYGVDAGGFDKSALLRSFGQCAFETFRDFRERAVELALATQRADALATPASRAAARAAWENAMDSWQRAELMGFGPTAASGGPGARDLRDPIDAWPLVSRCLIEQQLLDKTYERPEFGTALVSSRGLAAAEYLLFFEGTDNACPPTATLNTQGTWAALGPELPKRKSAYARVIGSDVARRSEELLAAWDPARQNFVGTMESAGKNDVFATQQLAFNAVSNAIFYVDDALKTAKVAKPAGFVPACVAPPCLSDVESPWAKRSKKHMENNLASFERLMRGCGPDNTGLGWDDLLVAVGAEGLNQRLTSATLDVRKALAALSQPTFEEDLQRDKPGVQRLYDALRTLVALMKTEFISVLDLEIPKRVEGDND